jgi:hypothetical protein
MLRGNEGPALNTTYTGQSGCDTTAVLRFDYFVDSVHGNDKNAGISPDAAFQTFAPLAGKSLRQGVGIARGSTVQLESFVSNNGGSGGHIVIFGSYGTGPLSTLKDSSQCSSAAATPVIGADYAALDRELPGNSDVLDGPGDLSDGTVDPYINSMASDLRPHAGSPLTCAGVAIPGITVGTSPDIGYTGAR